MTSSEDRWSDAAAAEGGGGDVVYKTKTVNFLGRTTPIILQNDNGPCPLLAICNVLLLRNDFNLNPNAPEVPLQELLALLADKLLSSNKNIQDKDNEYASNQQLNLSDAMNVLPRLATGIDVNVRFTKFNDFEFTAECTIFDFLNIGLCHGWIVDPQDTDTAEAIGSKSYNALVEELVAFETRNIGIEDSVIQKEDSVDFASATAATLGIPSPILSKGISFDDCPVSVAAEKLRGKGDREEETELMKVLDLSRTEISSPINKLMSSSVDCSTSSLTSEGITDTNSTEPVMLAELSAAHINESEKPHQLELSEAQESNVSDGCKDDGLCSKAFPKENDSRSAGINFENETIQPASEESEEQISSDSLEKVRTDILMHSQGVTCKSTIGNGSNGHNTCTDHMISSGQDLSVTESCSEDFTTSKDKVICDSAIFPARSTIFPTLSERTELQYNSEVITSNLKSSEPIYEGEEHIDSEHLVFEDQEPVYEGEMVLAEQVDNNMKEDVCFVNSKPEVQQKWQLIWNFLENNASQLTVYGLFCLQESLEEREFYVFFRNNHFSTMFKYEGELYLLATDQGYINQSDLVWEKLNEVNGDTIFMTGNFMEFKAENRENDPWNEQSVVTSTADYLSTFEGSSPSSSALTSDLQLAIALQQQEFEQQPQQPQQQNQQQSFVSGRSQLVTGPQAQRSTNSSQKSDSKSKDKCVVM